MSKASERIERAKRKIRAAEDVTDSLILRLAAGMARLAVWFT